MKSIIGDRHDSNFHMHDTLKLLVKKEKVVMRRVDNRMGLDHSKIYKVNITYLSIRYCGSTEGRALHRDTTEIQKNEKQKQREEQKEQNLY